MADVDLTQSALGFVPLILLEWGSSEMRYARSREPLTIDGETYLPMPEMDISFPMLNGGTEDKPVKITVPTTADPFDKMIITAFPETQITIMEGDFGDLNATPLIAYVGHVQKTKAHYKGKSRLMEVSIVGRKFFLKDVSLGLKCTDKCPWFYGDDVCGDTPTSVSAEVSTVDGNILNFTTLPSDSIKGSWASGRYTRGVIEKDGLRIMIRQHHVGSKKFTMAKPPPQQTGYTWDGETVTVYEGCDKSVAACGAHGQSEYFGGFGLLMPKYNPIIENPD